MFQSWQNDRADLYRRANNIPVEWGTAVNVQAMVFGNKGDDSATGVCFTRDPASGENVFYGEFLVNAQGEDVVAGIRTPQKIEALGNDAARGLQAAARHPQEAREALQGNAGHRVHDRERRLYMLQCRNGKRTGFAGVRIAVEMVDEKLIRRRRRCAASSPRR